MITLFLLFLLLDFQHPPKSDDPTHAIYVQEVVEQTTTGCAMNPSSGNRFNADMISVDQLAAGPQNELPLGYNNPLPMGAGVGERNNVERFIGAEGFRDGTASSPNPDPPSAVVPEPPTVAILTISALVLLFLIFGRAKKQRLVRR